MLKLAHERPNSFLLESVEGGATRGPLFDHRLRARPDLARERRERRGQSRAASGRRAFAPSPLPALASLRALLAESAIDLPSELPPMAAGIFGYMGYDTVRLIEHLPERQARPTRPARQHSGAADPDRDLRHSEGRDDRGDAGQARARRQRQGGLRTRRRPPERRGRTSRAASAACARSRGRGAHPDAEGATHRAGGLYGEGRAGQGVHRRRRYLSGGAEPALRGAVHASVLLALPGAAARQSLALSLLPQFRRVRGGRDRAQRSWCACATASSPSVRSPARGRAARRRRRTRRWRRSCSPMPRSAPSI